MVRLGTQMFNGRSEMIATRFNPLGVEGKPYAYEVGYLESTGTQYIDTGIVPNNETGVKLEFLVKTSKSDMFRFGCRQDNGDSRFIIGTDLNGMYAGFGNAIQATPAHTNVVDRKNIAELNFFNDRQFVTDIGVSGTQLSDISNITFTYSLIMFGRNSGGSISSNAQTVYACQITQGGSFVRDLIPVVDHDGVACMYDKVSKRLFYNQGTGEFIAGPRIFPVGNVSAKDYIQDGLILHLDALENGGFGIHDENATEWVDLSGYGRNATIRKLVEGDYKPFKADHCLVEGEKFILQVSGFNMNEVLTQAFCLTATEEKQSYARIIAENTGFSFGTLSSVGLIFYGYGINTSLYLRLGYDVPTSIAMSQDEAKVFYKNAIEMQRIDSTTKAITTSAIYFGGRTDGNRNGTFKYHNIQLYNRPLTQEELAYNDSIHRERYGFAL